MPLAASISLRVSLSGVLPLLADTEFHVHTHETCSVAGVLYVQLLWGCDGSQRRQQCGEKMQQSCLHRNWSGDGEHVSLAGEYEIQEKKKGKRKEVSLPL